MRIGFFQEYRSEKNFSKLSHINFPINLYIGAKNVSDFLQAKHLITKRFSQVKRFIYWPILDISEGYWISAFTKTDAIKRISDELARTNIQFPVLWDAELPTLNKKLFITELPHVLKNRKLIQHTLKNQSKNHPFIVAEFPKHGLKQLLSFIGGSSFSFNEYHRLDMLYTSIINVNLRNTIKIHQEKYASYTVGLGLIGKDGNDPARLLTSTELDRDLAVVQKAGIKEAVLYRLDGLNNEYTGIVKKYVQ